MESMTEDEDSQCAAEGWTVADMWMRPRILRIEEAGRFASDAEAVWFVRDQAARGSSMHAKALRVCSADPESVGRDTLADLRRKRDQAWELSGCARVDGDKADEARWAAKAREYTTEIVKRINEGEL